MALVATLQSVHHRRRVAKKVAAELLTDLGWPLEQVIDVGTVIPGPRSLVRG
jgi:hypothetical protein